MKCGGLWLCRRQLSQFEEGDAGTLDPIYQDICQPWITFMAKLGKFYLYIRPESETYLRSWGFIFCERSHSALLSGCPSIQQCTTKTASHFLLPSILAEIVSLVSSLAADTTVKTFRKTRWVFTCFHDHHSYLPNAESNKNTELWYFLLPSCMKAVVVLWHSETPQLRLFSSNVDCCFQCKRHFNSFHSLSSLQLMLPLRSALTHQMAATFSLLMLSIILTLQLKFEWLLLSNLLSSLSVQRTNCSQPSWQPAH